MNIRAWYIRYVLQDRERNIAEMRVTLPFASNTYSQAESYAATIAARIAVLSDGSLIQYSIHKFYDVAPSGQPASTSDVGRTGVIVVRLLNDNYTHINIPSVRWELFLDVGLGYQPIVLDESNQQLMDSIAVLIDSTDEYGNPIVEYVIGGLAT